MEERFRRRAVVFMEGERLGSLFGVFPESKIQVEGGFSKHDGFDGFGYEEIHSSPYRPDERKELDAHPIGRTEFPVLGLSLGDSELLWGDPEQVSWAGDGVEWI